MRGNAKETALAGSVFWDQGPTERPLGEVPEGSVLGRGNGGSNGRLGTRVCVARLVDTSRGFELATGGLEPPTPGL